MNRRSVEGREPALINLPVDLPSLPVVDSLLAPILTPLIAGPKAGSSPTATTTQPPTTQPPATQPTTTGSPNNGNTGNGNSSTGGQQTGGQQTGGQQTGGQQTGGQQSGGQQVGGGNGGQSSGQAGGGNGGQGVSIPTGGANAGNGGQNGSGNTGGNTSAGSGSSAAGSPAGTASSSGASTTDRTNGAGNGNLAGSPLINLGSDPNSSSVPVGGNVGTMSGTFVTSPTAGSRSGGGNTSGPSGGGTGGGNGNTVDSSGASSASGSHGLSGGAIAGIVIGILFVLLALFILLGRRRFIKRRQNRRDRWVGVGAENSAYDFSDTSRRASDPFTSNNNTAAGLQSARSSFATSYDISSPVATTENLVPDMAYPQMAELRDQHGPGTFTQRTAVPHSPRSPPLGPLLIAVDDVDRAHRDSDSSIDPYSQRQVIYTSPSQQQRLSPGLAPEPSTPMSVRPFSPTESFSFPKPPLDEVSGGQRQSSVLLPQGYDYAGPFADAVAFTDVEMVKRPFLPTRDDELGVYPGEKVKILQIFDDGWAAVQKLETEDGKGKNKSAHGGPGLIPVDCFRDAGEKLPDFLASKRVNGIRYNGY